LLNLDTEHELIHSHSYSISSDSFGISEAVITKWKYLFMLLIPLAILDNWFTFLSIYRPILNKRELICDRYFYDKVARAVYYGICPWLIARIWIRLIPKPDVVFFLTEPHVQKEEINNYEKWREIYKRIENELP